MNIREDKAIGWMTVVLAVLSGLLLGLLITPGKGMKGSSNMELTKLDQAMGLIERYYVDDMDRDTLTEQMLQAMLSSLDPHSHYLSKKALQSEEAMLQGGFDGIGVILFYQGDTACVSQVIPGGPSERAGLIPGDRILKADTVKLAGVGMKQEEVVSHLRGRKGSRVTLSIKRYGEEGTRHVQVTRNTVSTPSVNFYDMLDSHTGYIILSRFCETSAKEFRHAVADLKGRGMDHLILDLRNNGGGLLTAALEIADELLPGNELIVYTQGEHQRREDLRSSNGGLFTEGKLTVMINEYSASASEIIAGTVQDNDRGTIVGRRSFGKGLVQRQFHLKDGSAIFLTTARYHTPSGRCIQRPYDKGSDEYYEDFLAQVLESATHDSSLTKPTDTTKYYTTGGRVVYAGGGILPDKPLKLFTDSLLVYYNGLVNKQVLRQYAFDYVTIHYRELMARYPDEKSFAKGFVVTDAMMNDIIARGKEKGLQPNPRTLKRYEVEIRTNIKANVAEMLYSTEAHYRMMLPFDSELTQTRKMF